MECLLFFLIGFVIMLFVKILEKVFCKLDENVLEKIGQICAKTTWICICIIVAVTILPINNLLILKISIYSAIITFLMVLVTDGACKIKGTT